MFDSLRTASREFNAGVNWKPVVEKFIRALGLGIGFLQ